jgi:hypothetical protein
MAAKNQKPEKMVLSKMGALDTAVVSKLDTTVAKALDIEGEGSFERAMVVAEAMAELREAITPPMLARFKSLANSRLGFLTDKDPNKWDKRANNGNGGWTQPYNDEVLTECLIEATLRGLLPVGNQFNIIAGSVYTTKEGYKAQLKKLKGLQDFAPIIGTPRTVQGHEEFFVRCKGRAVYNGQQVSFGETEEDKIEIPVKGDKFSTVDSVKGKAERKFLKIVFERLTGIETPDGDISEAQVLSEPTTPAAGKLTAGQADHARRQAQAPAGNSVLSPIEEANILRGKCEELGITELELCQWAELNKFTQGGCESIDHLVEVCPSKLSLFIDQFEDIAEQIVMHIKS